MSLYEVLKKRGYTIRQHVEEEMWGARKPTVIDLDRLHRQYLEEGGIEALKKKLDSQIYRPPWGLFTFPALDIESPVPQRRDLLLARNGVSATSVVAPRNNPLLWAMARELVETVKDRHGAHDLPLNRRRVRPPSSRAVGSCSRRAQLARCPWPRRPPPDSLQCISEPRSYGKVRRATVGPSVAPRAATAGSAARQRRYRRRSQP